LGTDDQDINGGHWSDIGFTFAVWGAFAELFHKMQMCDITWRLWVKRISEVIYENENRRSESCAGVRKARKLADSGEGLRGEVARNGASWLKCKDVLLLQMLEMMCEMLHLMLLLLILLLLLLQLSVKP
jgi:hypothetical protein